jgi:hypothetical protein
MARAWDRNNPLTVILMFAGIDDLNYNPSETRSLNWTIEVSTDIHHVCIPFTHCTNWTAGGRSKDAHEDRDRDREKDEDTSRAKARAHLVGVDLVELPD